MPAAGDTIYATQLPGLIIAQLYETGVQVLTSSAEEDVEFNSVALDRQGGWVAGTPTRYTPTVAGWYLISGMVGYPSNSTGTRRAALKKNGSYVQGGFVQENGSTVGTYRLPTPTVAVEMNGTTDYFSLAARQSSGADMTLLSNADGNTFLTVVYGGGA